MQQAGFYHKGTEDTRKPVHAGDDILFSGIGKVKTYQIPPLPST